MTTVSMAVSFCAAFCCALFAGRCLRNVRAGSAVAVLLAATVGLTLLRTAQFSELQQLLQPKTALDWLPMVCLLNVTCVLIAHAKFRVACGVILAVLIPVRLLWGSVYLQPDQSDVSVVFVVLSIVVWFTALAVPLIMRDGCSGHRISWNTTVWGLSIAGTATLIALSGSLTYGAAAGVCGLAALGVLLATAQIPNVAAVPFVCLIGLAASFSDLSLLVAGLMLLVWIAVQVADQVSTRRIAAAIRVGSFCGLLLAGSLTLISIAADNQDADMSAYHGGMLSHQNWSNSEFDKLATERPGDTPVEKSSPVSSVESAEPQDGTADPFGGLE